MNEKKVKNSRYKKSKQVAIETSEPETLTLESFPHSEIDVNAYIEAENVKINDRVKEISTAIDKLKLFPDTTLSFFIRILFSIPTLFLCWIGFVSKNRAIAHNKKYQALKIELNTHLENQEEHLRKLKRELRKENQLIREHKAELAAQLRAQAKQKRKLITTEKVIEHTI